MDFIWKLNVVVSAYVALLHILILLVQLNESATIDDLRVACGIKYKGDKQDVFFDTIPENCTSIIMNCNDFPDEQTFYDMVKANQPDVPLFLIEDTVSFNAWVTEFDTISQCAQSYIDQIDKYNLDGIFFDNLYPEQITGDYSTSDVITNGIPKFFGAIKEHYNCKNKDIILGIVFPWNPDIIKHGFSYEIIDNSVDAYLCNLTNYAKECTDTGGSLFSSCKLKETANQFYSFTDNLKHLTKSKIVMELQLYVKDAKYNTEISYEESCALCPGTIVCQDTLKSLYTKAMIINDFQFAGAYIRYCNQDDNHGRCYCGHKTPFPGVAAIAAGIQGLDLEYIECLSFGVPGIYRPNETCENPLTCPIPSLTEPLSVSNETEDFDVFILIFSPDSSPSEQESTETSDEIESLPNLNTDPIV